MISKLRETLASFCWHFPLAETVASFAAHLSHPAWLTGKLAASYSEGLGSQGPVAQDNSLLAAPAKALLPLLG